MEFGEVEVKFTPLEEEKTGLPNPLNIFEFDLHTAREDAITELARLEKEFVWQEDASVTEVLTSLGEKYERVLARKLALTIIAIEYANRSGIERILDDDN